MKNKYRKKVLGNVGISLFTSTLCLAFLVICFSGATLAIFNSRKEYKFATIFVEIPDASLQVENLNDELNNEFDDNTVINDNEIDSINNENEGEEEVNNELDSIHEVELMPGSYKVTVNKVGNADGYCFLHIFDYDTENEKFFDETLENYIIDIKDAKLNGDYYFYFKTTSKAKLTIDNFTWNDSLKNEENFLSLNDSIIPEDAVTINHGGIVVTFNPGFETYDLPEGYDQLTFVRSYVDENTVSMPTININDRDLEIAVEKDGEYFPKVFIDVIDFNGLKLIPCMNKNNNSIGLYLNESDNTFYELNNNPSEKDYGAVPINSTFMDVVGSGFEEPFAIDDDTYDLEFPENQFVRFAYHFLDWGYNDFPVGNVPFNNYKNDAIDNNEFNIEFVALWEKNFILISDDEENTSAYYYDDDLVHLLEIPFKEGFTFEGYKDDDGDLILGVDDISDLNNWINLINNSNSTELHQSFIEIEE